mmetsp:Transcript_2460/g.5721  ORF Transcript_2460/g.5721 Transcript_2460/m.5721 type:complete len:397 (+) Transcript_2460:1608-2798(+)
MDGFIGSKFKVRYRMIRFVIAACLRCHFVPRCVVIPKPLDKGGNSLLDARLRVVPEKIPGLGHVRIRRGHVPLLHADRLDECFLSHPLLDDPDEVGQYYRVSVAQVDELGPSSVDKQRVDDALDNVPDKSKVPLGLAVVEDADGLVVGNLVRKDPGCHVRSPERPVHRKESQPDAGNVVEIEIGPGDELVASFRCCVQRGRILDGIRLQKGNLDVVSVDTRGRSVHQRLLSQVEFFHDLQQVHGAIDVVVYVIKGMVQAVSDPGLGRQVNEPGDVVVSNHLLELVGVTDVSEFEMDASAFQLRNSRSLEIGGVVVVDVVVTNWCHPQAFQFYRGVHTNKPRGAGDQNVVLWSARTSETREFVASHGFRLVLVGILRAGESNVGLDDLLLAPAHGRV